MERFHTGTSSHFQAVLNWMESTLWNCLLMYWFTRQDESDRESPMVHCCTHRSVYIYPDDVPPIHVVSYRVATDKPPSPPPLKMATSSGLFLAIIFNNQSQLAERKHVARYWSINTAATAVPLSAHPSRLVITTKLAAAILGGGWGGGCSEEVICRPSTAPVATMTVNITKWLYRNAK